MSVPPASSHLSNSEKTLGLALLPFSRSSLDPTLLSSITPHANSLSYPIYYSSAPSLIPGVSDRYTALAVPIVAYWVLGGLFHLVDVMQWEYFEKRRIHESEEVLQRNRVSMPQVSTHVHLLDFGPQCKESGQGNRAVRSSVAGALFGSCPIGRWRMLNRWRMLPRSLLHHVCC